jgi:prepilin-type N-terminal cleavage/methylation domain-containing protein
MSTLPANTPTEKARHAVAFNPPLSMAVRSAPSVRAFTLVELLVAIAIVGILIALLVPVISAAIGTAYTVECQSHLRLIGIAYDRHMTDSKGLWPPILTSQVPTAMLDRFSADAGLARAPARPADNWGQPGPHWSIVLWPYIGDLRVYTCPADPKAGLRGLAVTGSEREHGAALLDAPPESYAINAILFRTSDDFRRKAGCLWGIKGDADYNGLDSCTTLAEQRRQFPNLSRHILFFCGASGQTVGSQFNIPFRTTGLVDRWAWHPCRASEPFVDEPGCGSNYLYGDGRVEYHETLPPPADWGYEISAGGGAGLPPAP